MTVLLQSKGQQTVKAGSEEAAVVSGQQMAIGDTEVETVGLEHRGRVDSG